MTQLGRTEYSTTISDAEASTLCEWYDRLSKASAAIIAIDVRTANRKLEFQMGDPAVFGTSSYWILQYNLLRESRFKTTPRHASDLAGEVVACLLGGYRVRAEIASTAFEQLTASGILDQAVSPSAEVIEEVLERPIVLAGHQYKYPFPRQRAGRICESLRMLSRADDVPTDPVALCDWLLRLPGVGNKTAAWIVRNATGSSRVAVVDVHQVRAGRNAGWFPGEWNPQKDYAALQEAFLAACDAMDVEAATLDSIIWEQMRAVGSPR